LGNLASSASSTIEAKIGERFPLQTGANGVNRYNYGSVICILSACGFAFVALVVFLGPEHKWGPLNVVEDLPVALEKHDARDVREEYA
jgi:SHS family lactate transporter-like MFS transporter